MAFLDDTPWLKGPLEASPYWNSDGTPTSSYKLPYGKDCIDDARCSSGYKCIGGRCVLSEDNCSSTCGGGEDPFECEGQVVYAPVEGTITSCGGTTSQEKTCVPTLPLKCSQFCDNYYDAFATFAAGCNEENVCGLCAECDQNSACQPFIPQSFAGPCFCPSHDNRECYVCEGDGNWRLDTTTCEKQGFYSEATDCDCTKAEQTFEATATVNTFGGGKPEAKRRAKRQVERLIAEYCADAGTVDCGVPVAEGSIRDVLLAAVVGPSDLYQLRAEAPPHSGDPLYKDIIYGSYNPPSSCPTCPTEGMSFVVTYNEAEWTDPGPFDPVSLCPGDWVCQEVGDIAGVYKLIEVSNASGLIGQDGEPNRCGGPGFTQGAGRYAAVYKDQRVDFNYRLCDCDGPQTIQTLAGDTRYFGTSRTNNPNFAISFDDDLAGGLCFAISNNASLATCGVEYGNLSEADICNNIKPGPQGTVTVLDGDSVTVAAFTAGFLITDYSDLTIYWNDIGTPSLGYPPLVDSEAPPKCTDLPPQVALIDFAKNVCYGTDDSCAYADTFYGVVLDREFVEPNYFTGSGNNCFSADR